MLGRRNSLTLHIAFNNGRYSTQVGDRLLTRKTGDGISVWESAANKSIFLMTTNGILAVGFSGAAHIDGNPTDHHLAQAITGLSLSDPGNDSRIGVGIRSGAFQTLNVGKVRRSIVDSLESSRIRNVRANQPITVLLSGWTCRRRASSGSRRPRSFISRITQRTDRVSEEFAFTGYLNTSGRGIRATGNTESFGRDSGRLARLANELVFATKEGVERALVEEVRWAAGQTGGENIGTDCMAITIDAFDHRHTATYYWQPNGQHAPHWYMPRIAVPGLIAPPQIAHGSGPSIWLDPDEPPVMTFHYKPEMDRGNNRRVSIRSQRQRTFP